MKILCDITKATKSFVIWEELPHIKNIPKWILWLVIDRYGNFHLTDTDTDMVILTHADTDTD